MRIENKIVISVKALNENKCEETFAMACENLNILTLIQNDFEVITMH